MRDFKKKKILINLLGRRKKKEFDLDILVLLGVKKFFLILLIFIFCCIYIYIYDNSFVGLKFNIVRRKKNKNY